MIDFGELLESSGAVLHGHFLLTSGRHSDVYFEKFRVLEQPQVLSALCAEIAGHFAVKYRMPSTVTLPTGELHTSLIAIKGFVTTLRLDDGFTADERSDFYGIIDGECDRLVELAGDALIPDPEPPSPTPSPSAAQTSAQGAGARIDLVAGPTTGGIIIAFEVARRMGLPALYVETENGQKKLRRGAQIPEGAKVLIVDDVLTTGTSIREVIQVVQEAGGIPAGVGVLIDRTETPPDFGVPLFAAYKVEAQTFAADEVPDWLAALPITKPGTRATV